MKRYTVVGADSDMMQSPTGEYVDFIEWQRLHNALEAISIAAGCYDHTTVSDLMRGLAQQALDRAASS